MRFKLLSLLLVSGALTTIANAANIVNDFSLASNPNGAWSYGSTPTLGGAFTLFPNGYVSTDFDVWDPFTGGLPVVYKNNSAADLNSGTAFIPLGWLNMHPSVSGEYAVVRYTIPASGAYLISGDFEGHDSSGPTSTDVHVRLNSATSLFSGNVALYLNPQNFSIPQSFNAGDTVDFAVGFGSNSNYFYDTTGLRGSINPVKEDDAAVPEPSTILMLGGGLGLLAAMRLRARFARRA